MEDNKKVLSKKYIILLIAVAVVAIVTVILCCFVFKGDNNKNDMNGTNVSTGTNTSSGTNTSGWSNDDLNNTNSGKYSSTELEKNIICNGAVTEKGNLIAFVKNNNDIPVDIDVEAEFYDKDGMIVGSSSYNYYDVVGADTEVAIEFWNTPDEFDNYKIYVDASIISYYYKSYVDSVELIHNNTGKNIVVQVKNNSGVELDKVEVAVVYYSGDVVVGYNSGSSYDVKTDRSANITLSYPYNRNYKNVYFDSYKVFINEAYARID